MLFSCEPRKSIRLKNRREFFFMDIKIAICFFGITRSLTHTIGSIDENILAPACELGEVRIFAHFFRQATIDNLRSGEEGPLKQNEHNLLASDWLKLEDPNHCIREHGFEALKSFGDSWNDGFSSLRNLIHQLHSMKQVTDVALDWSPDLVLFVRPDLIYHDNLGPEIAKAMKCKAPAVTLPNWQNWHGGYNDRFAICRGKAAAGIYGGRVTELKEFCVKTDSPVHSERLLSFVLENAGIKPSLMSARASRVRANGIVKRENFSGPTLSAMRIGVSKVIKTTGLKSFVMRVRQTFSSDE